MAQLGIFDAEEINGELFQVASGGDKYVPDAKCAVPLIKCVGQFPDGQEMEEFFHHNVRVLVGAQVQLDYACKIAYLRSTVFRLGLYDLRCNRDGGLLSHDDCYVTSQDVRDGYQDVLKDPESNSDDAKAFAAVNAHVLSGTFRAWKAGTKHKVATLLHLVAFIFRVRGHHWQNGYDEQYDKLYNKIFNDNHLMTLPWEHIARSAFHAVYPRRLDAFWKKCIDEGNCDRIMTLRYESFSAGTAIVGSLRTCMNDFFAVMPLVKELHKDAVNYMAECEHSLEEDRWAGSINHRYYGAQNYVIQESKFAAIASIIISILETVAPQSYMLKSPALRRVASNAPMSGGLVSSAILAAARSKRAQLAFLPPDKLDE